MSSPSRPNPPLRFAEFELDPVTGELRNNSRVICLQDKPLQILLLLLERRGDLVTREELIQRLWGTDTYVDFDQSLNKAVNRLRESIGDSANSPRLIETFPRRGYRMAAGTSPTKSHASDEFAPVDDSENSLPDTPLLSHQERRLNGDRRLSVPSPLSARVVGPRPNHRAWMAVLAIALALGGVYVAYRWPTLRQRFGMAPDLDVTPLTKGSHVASVAFSREGRYLAYELRRLGQSSLHIREVGNRGDAEILPAESAGFNGLAFSPDSSQLFYVRADRNDPGFKHLYVMPPLGGAPRKLIDDIDSPVSFSPDGRRFVFTRGIPNRNATELRMANSDRER
jgi:DNA-binding winged helix-turn-helix (wHTH) protein